MQNGPQFNTTEADLRTRLFDAEAALAELVRLKDGPRDAAYERAKPIAWSRARAVLAQIPEFHSHHESPERLGAQAMLTSNYVDPIVTDLAALLPDCDIDLLRLYALLVLVKGADTTLKDVHDAWSVGRAATHPDHRSIVPFEDLTPEVQALDGRYAQAIRRVASTT